MGSGTVGEGRVGSGTSVVRISLSFVRKGGTRPTPLLLPSSDAALEELAPKLGAAAPFRSKRASCAPIERSVRAA